MTVDDAPEQLSRRQWLSRAAALGSIAIPVAGWAQGSTTPSMTPAGMAIELPADAGTHPPAVFPGREPFDLNDARERSLARLKVLVSLTGERAYLSVLSRHFLCPPGVPPKPWVNELELFTMFLERTPAGDVQRSIFTRVFVDPESLRPISELKDPFTGGVIPVGDRLFALTLPVKLEPEAQVRNVNEAQLPLFRCGEWIDFPSLAVRVGEGFHQPSFDTSTWRVRYDDLQSRRKPRIEAHYSFSSLLRGSFLSWSRMDRGDPTQVLTAKTGLKVNSPSALPTLVRELIADRYPNRL
jgi:hypothetical protein